MLAWASILEKTKPKVILYNKSLKKVFFSHWFLESDYSNISTVSPQGNYLLMQMMQIHFGLIIIL